MRYNAQPKKQWGGIKPSEWRVRGGRAPVKKNAKKGCLSEVPSPVQDVPSRLGTVGDSPRMGMTIGSKRVTWVERVVEEPSGLEKWVGVFWAA